ncbi:nuclear transport factor 2 family protein [Azospirillum humicireducens]|nr:nuclear transport factor 2 family protein [Azospirillum humicireducens]
MAVTEQARRVIEAAVLKQEARRCAALVADDIAMLDELMADDLVHVHTTGIVHGKEQLLEHASRFLRFYDVRRGDLLVRVPAETVVIVTGPMTNLVGRRDTDEKIEVNSFVTQVWALENGAWRAVSFHAVKQA